jgi:hypothetical protein
MRENVVLKLTGPQKSLTTGKNTGNSFLSLNRDARIYCTHLGQWWFLYLASDGNRDLLQLFRERRLLPQGIQTELHVWRRLAFDGDWAFAFNGNFRHTSVLPTHSSGFVAGDDSHCNN